MQITLERSILPYKHREIFGYFNKCYLNAGDQGLIPGSEDPLEKGMATHSSILAWRFHGQRSLVGPSPWDCRVRHNGETNFCFYKTQRNSIESWGREKTGNGGRKGKVFTKRSQKHWIKLAHKFIFLPRARAASEGSQPDSPSDYIHLVLTLEKHIT